MNFTEYRSVFNAPSFPGGGGAAMWFHQHPTEEQLIVHAQFDCNPAKKPRFTEERNPSIPFAQSSIKPSILLPPRGTANIFFKTRICTRYLSGVCRNGENCKFAHGDADLRRPPENWQEFLSGDNNSASRGGDQKMIQSMKLCRKFFNGEECPYGDRCNFLHQDPLEFKNDTCRSVDNSFINLGTSVLPKHDPAEIDRSAYWKTRLCIKFEATGQCPFGDRCHFAHGVADLQRSGSHTQHEKGTSEVYALGNSGMNPSDVNMNSVSVESGERRKSLLNWKGSKKIKRIYADWIDDDLL